jgi:hypothetical protein
MIRNWPGCGSAAFAALHRAPEKTSKWAFFRFIGPKPSYLSH